MKNPPGFRPKPLARNIWGRMQYAPTRVREKPGGFHISTPGYAKNVPDFTLSNRDAPKTCPILGANRRRGTFRGVCFCAPTRVRTKFGGFHIFPIEIRPKPTRFYTQIIVAGHFGAYAFAPLHGYVQNLTGFIFPHTDTSKTHPISPFPIRIHPKPARFYT